MVLRGDVPDEVRPLFFGASLVALRKKTGGVRSIAVGCTLRRLVAKVASRMVRDEMEPLLSPKQLGYGVKGGAEAAVHAMRSFLSSLAVGRAVVKLDFQNAFNSIHRDKMLEATRDIAPEIFPFVHSSYSSPSHLLWGDRLILSAEGVQQGDPLGPLLFRLTLHQYCQCLSADLCVSYLDDVTIGGSCTDILQDLEVVKLAEDIGLTLNLSKCEIITQDHTTFETILTSIPGDQLVDPANATLLGSPLGDGSCVSRVIAEKIDALKRVGEKFEVLSAHDALFLLRNSFAIPKFQYLLRTAPCFKSEMLIEYDNTLHLILSEVTNTAVASDDRAWTQASLPVKLGGLGVRSAVELAPSAFLASMNMNAALVEAILPTTLCSSTSPLMEDALSNWLVGHDSQPPTDTEAQRQKHWDHLRSLATATKLEESATDDIDRARLLASRSGESGAWLHALPISTMGLRLDDDSLRIAVGLRLGTPLCGSHQCHHCGEEVDVMGRHGLSCRWSKGRHHRHAALNDIIHRALTSAHVPARLEPQGMLRSDGKRPDGVSMVPWRSGKCLVWDVTCVDTFAPSYRSLAVQGPGTVAVRAESLKEEKYFDLLHTHEFAPIAVETSGVFGPRTLAFVKELGRRLGSHTGEEKACTYLIQRMSIAVQRGNAISILGNFGSHWHP